MDLDVLRVRPLRGLRGGVHASLVTDQADGTTIRIDGAGDVNGWGAYAWTGPKPALFSNKPALGLQHAAWLKRPYALTR